MTKIIRLDNNSIKMFVFKDASKDSINNIIKWFEQCGLENFCILNAEPEFILEAKEN